MVGSRYLRRVVLSGSTEMTGTLGAPAEGGGRICTGATLSDPCGIDMIDGDTMPGKAVAVG